MSGSNDLGAYLRARRGLVSPQDAGLPPTGRRRVPGLRREEVALLAGISSEYYLRLEQGRDQHPSPQVLDALARVLMLDADATGYLHGLARPRRRRAPVRRPERVAEGTRRLVLAMSTPAFVQGRHLDVLVANPLATALSPHYVKGANLLRSAFLDPAVRAMYQQGEWERTIAGTVASLRALAGPETNDARLTELVGELSVRSEEFRRLWARHDVKPRTSGTSRLLHPQVGPLELDYEKLAVTGADGQLLVVYHAAPGSAAEQSLQLLRHLVPSDATPDSSDSSVTSASAQGTSEKALPRDG
ncbi:helix-turn-helix domain-containing protein [Streptomyces sp. NPDC088354]|uniref:helix-turn-helix domain-containing protein n=1 Tax=unclassified Streptomyces TaxID=2593676 RepID=UPI0029AABCD3|nr:helix-turn-helix transcriptional regulator [Streptomyces sp. MI02-7b]MDX3078561.1 helix-turn-helix transcriptional regulator [Streptomyces sp. MI02-7b]